MSDATKWQTFQLEDKITTILGLPDFAYEGRHYGNSFITAYQIAIEFEKRYLAEFQAIGMLIGGSGIGERTSLSQYIARMLSQHIQDGKIKHIEMADLHHHHILSLTFKHEDGPIRASTPEANYPTSLFRLKNKE